MDQEKYYVLRDEISKKFLAKIKINIINTYVIGF